MPREANKLSAPKVSKLKTPGRDCDGLGLWVQVAQAGTKTWLVRPIKPGSPGMPHNEATDAIIAAVGVTVLSRKKDRSVSDALRLVSKSSGLDMDWLRHKLNR